MNYNTITLIAATEIYCLNEQGKRRNNEDRIYPQEGTATSRDNLFIVCDGVGGENKGEVASEIVCTSVYQYINNQDFPLANGKEEIEKAIKYANKKLAEYAFTDGSARRMSTTLSLIYLNERSIITAWCGDSRIHHIRDGRVIWKSNDHSLVQELVKSGEISEAEARNHPKKNIITRSLNALNTNNTVDFHVVEDYKDDDFFLLCTDGFLEQIDEGMINSVLNNDAETDKAQQFFNLCVEKTKDNFSMYLVKVHNNEKTKKAVSLSNSHLIFTSLIVILCLVSIVVMFLVLRKNENVSLKSLHLKEITN